MRTYEEIVEDMRVGHTFSNMSEFEVWAVGWCARCRFEDSCPVVDAALLNIGARPAEWILPDGPGTPFHCTAFEPANERPTGEVVAPTVRVVFPLQAPVTYVIEP